MQVAPGSADGISGLRPKRDANPPLSPKRAEKKEGAGDDTLSVNPAAQQVSRLREALKDIPSVDVSKVEAIRGQIEAGAYRPDSASIAEGLMRAFAGSGGV